MAIRMRRGNEADFDPSKMLPGEWAVSTDTKYVRMCFSPGIVLRMATYEAFESDMAEMRKILSECQSIQTAVELIQKNVTNSELVIENYVKEAKQYRDEAEQFRNEASMFAPEGYEDLVKNVSDNTVKIDTIIEKAELNIKNNAKGSNIHLTDSADSNVVALELYGNTEQNAYTGKNLFKMREENISNSGITVTFDKENQSFSVEGTASANVTIPLTDNFEVLKEKFNKGGTFFMSMINATYNNPNFNVNVTYRLEEEESSRYMVPSGTADTIPSGSVVRTICLYVQSGLTVKASNVKIQIEEGNVATEYEPYVGGKPSPSPSYPQEIKSVKGKNLLDCRGLVEKTNNGVTFTPIYDENGNLLYINVNGTATAQASYYIGKASVKANEKYLGKGGNSVYTENYFVYLNGNKYIYKNDKEIVYTEDKNISAQIVVLSGVTVNNDKFYPMIREASIKDDTYVPYGLLRIKTHGKNLVESCIYNATSVDYDAIIGEVNTNLKKGRTYTASVDLTVQASTRVYWSTDAEVISNVSYQNVSNGTNRYSITFVAEKDSVNNKIWLKKANNGDNVLITPSNFMIEESPTMTEYQPYQSSEITLSEPIELNGFNGVYDVVTSDDVTRRFAEVVYDGSDDEGWNITSVSNGSRFYIKLNDAKASANVLCTQATISNCGISASLNFYIDVFSQYSSVAELKTHLVENPITIVYELATPTKEALQTDFTVLKTFYPETHVSNDADCDMSITYTADAKNYIDNKIALLTTAIYNNI